MPSLREQLRDVKTYGAISRPAYALLEALVEAVEPEDTDATLRKTTTEDYRQYWKKRCEKAETTVRGLRSQLAAVEPEDTDATIRNLRIERLDLRVERDGIDQRCSELEHQLAEAKADGDAWMRRCDELERLLAVQKASHADAEIGRLVRGMADRTRLIRGHPSNAACQLAMCYWAEKQGESTWLDASWHKVGKLYLKHDPTEALRSIQEVGDAEA